MAAGGGQEGKTGGPNEPKGPEDLDKFEPDKGAMEWAEKLGVEVNPDAKKQKLHETAEEIDDDLKRLKGTSNLEDGLAWARKTGILDNEDEPGENKPK